MRSVIFDLDGTLANTSGDLLAAANMAFDAAGLGRPLTALDAPASGFGGRAMLRVGLDRLGHSWDEDAILRWLPVFYESYEAAIHVESYLFDAAIDTIEALRADGWATAICTNKPDHMAEKLLQSFGVRDLFGCLVGADTVGVRKPDPAPLLHAIRSIGGDPGRAVLVGDTETDRKTGRAANVPVVLVTMGPEGERVREMHPEGVISDYRALPALLDLLVPRA